MVMLGKRESCTVLALFSKLAVLGGGGGAFPLGDGSSASPLVAGSAGRAAMAPRRPRRGVPNLFAALLGHPHLSSHPGFLVSARFRFMDIPQVFQKSQTLLHSTEAAKS